MSGFHIHRCGECARACVGVFSGPALLLEQTFLLVSNPIIEYEYMNRGSALVPSAGAAGGGGAWMWLEVSSKLSYISSQLL